MNRTHKEMVTPEVSALVSVVLVVLTKVVISNSVRNMQA